MSVLEIIASVVIGISLGLIGSGGSILTVPVLVYLLHAEPALATSYSLFGVGGTALVGAGNALFDWPFVLIFTGLSVLGIFIERYLSRYVPGAKLQRSFGWFVLIMAGSIIFLEALV